MLLMQTVVHQNSFLIITHFIVVNCVASMNPYLLSLLSMVFGMCFFFCCSYRVFVISFRTYPVKMDVYVLPLAPLDQV